MSRCNKCGKEHWLCHGYSFGYDILCSDCYNELVEKRDIKTVEQLNTDEVHELNPEQIVKNFVKYFAEYQKNPNLKTLDALWRIRCWACHEDHTASTTIHEIMKWQKFDFATEFEKLGKEW